MMQLTDQEIAGLKPFFRDAMIRKLGGLFPDKKMPSFADELAYAACAALRLAAAHMHNPRGIKH